MANDKDVETRQIIKDAIFDSETGAGKNPPDDRPLGASLFYSKEENENLREQNKTYNDAFDKNEKQK